MSLLGGSLWAEVARSRIITSFLLFNQTYVLGNVRPELFLSIIVGWLFLSVVFIFYNRYSYFYLLYLISKRIFHLGVLISRTHSNVCMSFAEWECFCFSSFIEYNFGFVNIQCIL